MAVTQRIAHAGMAFDAAVSGPEDGATVLLLHGFPQTHRCWDDVAVLLNEARLRTVAPDQRGYSPGARPTGVAAYRVEHLVNDAVGLLDALGVAKTHLVGHDWGASVAWSLAVQHPDRIRSLTALSTPHSAALAWARSCDADQRKRSAYIDLFRQEGIAEDALLANDAAWLRDLLTPVPSERAAVYLELCSQRPALSAMLAWYRATTLRFGLLEKCAVPTTYVRGADDHALGFAAAQRCGDHVAAPYRHVELTAQSHWLPELAPGVIADEIVKAVHVGTRGES